VFSAANVGQACLPLSETIVRAIESEMGKTIREVQEQTLSDRRREVEANHKGRRMMFSINFPFIGRGNVLRDRVLSHEEIDKQFNEALKDIDRALGVCNGDS
jgi:phosphoribosylformylglycinamidine (FGAM) synthase-like amidotransferase family enzyme